MMNNSLIGLASPAQTQTIHPSSIILNNSQIDPSQLMQITQLLNDLQHQQNQQQQQQQQNDCLINELNLQIQQNQAFQQQNLMEVLVSSTGSSTASSNTAQNLLVSPGHILKLDQFNSSQSMFLNDQQQQQQQQSNDQVHTIMLNGQPALFIPSSSVLSSNLLCQMLINSNTPQQQQQTNLEVINNNNDLTQLIANHLIQQQQQQSQLTNNNAEANNNSTTDSELVGYAQVLNACDQNFLQMPPGFFMDGQSEEAECKVENNEAASNEQIFCIQQQENGNLMLQALPFLMSSQNNVDKVSVENAKTKKVSKTKEIKIKTAKVNSKATNGVKTNENKKPNGSKKSGEKNAQNEWVVNNNNGGQIVANLSSELSALANNAIANLSHKSSSGGEEMQPLESSTLLDGKIKKKRKPCDCPNCVKWKQNLMTPEEMAKKRTHKCHKCTKEYNKTSHLRAHLRAHDNYRPYVCDFKTCGKGFTRSDELKRHKRIHNDDRNFTCHICNKKFLRSDHLNKHLLVHSKSAASSAAASNELTLSQECAQIKQEPILVDSQHSSASSMSAHLNQQSLPQ